MKKSKSTSLRLRPEIPIVLVVLISAGFFLIRSHPPEEEDQIDFADEVYEPTAAEKELRWLQAHQHEEGFWSMSGEAQDRRPGTEATALALLAFLSHGETPASADFGPTVAKTLRFLVENQEEDGSFPSTEPDPVYGHAIATYALIEAYLMTENILLRQPCELALQWMFEHSDPSDGWRLKVWQSEARTAGKMTNLTSPTMGGHLDDFVKGDQYPGWGNQERSEVYGEDPVYSYIATRAALLVCDKHRPAGRTPASVFQDWVQRQKEEGSFAGEGRPVVNTAMGVLHFTAGYQRFWYCPMCPLPCCSEEGSIGFEI